MTFHEDLAIGQRSEDYVLGIIRRHYPQAHRIKGKHSPYDILVPELVLTVEVKGDYRSQQTGNIVVEVNHPIGTPSGLLVTTADYWVHDTGRELIWIKPQHIKDCIMVYNYKPRDFKAGDDREAKRVYLIPVHIYRTFATRCYEYR